MSTVKYEVRPGAYYDSVVLMQLQRALAGLPDVVDAGVVMATEANRELLAASDLLPDDVEAKADDLLIVVRAENEARAREALSQVDSLLRRQRSTASQAFRPRSLEAALKMVPDAGWVLISVPGRYAAGVTREAVEQGRHVFLYSDNVSLEDELSLKQEAHNKGLLVMGPDCGTAIINGVGLGFANRVRRGNIGLVGASGTGLQAIASHIHNLGGGVSQAIGTGGRDLKAEIGAITARQGLDLLSRDPETKVIILVSKPPSSEVATRLLAAAQAAHKQVVVNFLGYPVTARRLDNLHFATSLSEAAELAVEIGDWREEIEEISDLQVLDYAQDRSAVAGYPSQVYLRGLFSGGTLAYEALLGLQMMLSPIYSNVPIRKEQHLPDPFVSRGHTILDLGEDQFTQGRLHPMLDNDLRLRRLRQEAADPEVGLVLIDVVLGQGAHPDPASEVAPAIAEVKKARADLEVVAVVVGTDEDPQDLNAQIERLIAAGTTVFPSTAEAIDYVSRYLSQPAADAFPRVPLNAFQEPLTAVNVGLETFYDSLKAQGAEVVQVDWRPPAGGNEKLMAILAKMKAREV
ncbi:MAG TPA: acyl-CoA synthetase FdrA [Anaerolineae bacterium]